jgi:hypothetical protein
MRNNAGFLKQTKQSLVVFIVFSLQANSGNVAPKGQCIFPNGVNYPVDANGICCV